MKDRLPTTSGRFEVTVEGKRRHVEIYNYNKGSELYAWGGKWNEVNVIAWRERDKPYNGD